MARTVTVIPKAVLTGNQWLLQIRVVDNGQFTLHEQSATSAVTITGSAASPKLVLEVSITDTATAQDIVNALTVDDVVPGQRVASAWDEYRTRLESSVATSGRNRWLNYTSSLSGQVRTAVQRGFNARGWTILGFHQHEGDGTVLEG